MSESAKMFSVAGVSQFKGQFKVRFANDLARVKLLMKNDNTEIELLELPEPMSKPDAVKFLKTSALAERAEFLEAIDTADAKYNPVAVVKVRKPRASKKSDQPNMDKIRSRARAQAEQSVAEEENSATE
jgi:hypothetical protein